MTQPHGPVKARRLKKQREHVLRCLNLVNDAVLDEVDRRARYTAAPDGFGAGGTPDGGSRSTVEMTTTERSALARIEGRRDDDPIQVECEKIDDAMRAMDRAAFVIERNWELIRTSRKELDTRKGQTTLVNCLACLRDVSGAAGDRLRGGYCPTCHRAWLRTNGGKGRQDRVAFERERLARTAEVLGYSVDDIDLLQASGVLPTPRRPVSSPEQEVVMESPQVGVDSLKLPQTLA